MHQAARSESTRVVFPLVSWQLRVAAAPYLMRRGVHLMPEFSLSHTTAFTRGPGITAALTLRTKQTDPMNYTHLSLRLSLCNGRHLLRNEHKIKCMHKPQTAHSATLPLSEPLPTTTTGHYTICCKNLSLTLLKMGKRLPETCWADLVDQ